MSTWAAWGEVMTAVRAAELALQDPRDLSRARAAARSRFWLSPSLSASSIVSVREVAATDSGLGSGWAVEMAGDSEVTEHKANANRRTRGYMVQSILS